MYGKAMVISRFKWQKVMTGLVLALWLALDFSCSNEANNYYLYSERKLLGLGGTYFLLAEIRNDSVQFQGISDDVVCGCYALSSPA